MQLYPASYLGQIFRIEDQRAIVEGITKVLGLYREHFDGICFRGVSGAMIAPIVGYKLNIPVVVIRKGEPCHSANRVDGRLEQGKNRLVFIDDCIDSGATFSHVEEALQKEGCLIVGAVMYQPGFKEDGFGKSKGIPFICKERDDWAVVGMNTWKIKQRVKERLFGATVRVIAV